MRIDAVTTLVNIYLEGDIMHLISLSERNGKPLTQSHIDISTNFVLGGMCIPMAAHLNSGLTIKTVYYDEYGEYLFQVTTSKEACDRFIRNR